MLCSVPCGSFQLHHPKSDTKLRYKGRTKRWWLVLGRGGIRPSCCVGTSRRLGDRFGRTAVICHSGSRAQSIEFACAESSAANCLIELYPVPRYIGKHLRFPRPIWPENGAWSGAPTAPDPHHRPGHAREQCGIINPAVNVNLIAILDPGQSASNQLVTRQAGFN